MGVEDKITELAKEINHYGAWRYVSNELPDVHKFGDGNFCHVGVKTERGLMGRCLFGCSGFANEPYSFSQIIETDCGRVYTKDKVVSWKYIKPEAL